LIAGELQESNKKAVLRLVTTQVAHLSLLSWIGKRIEYNIEYGLEWCLELKSQKQWGFFLFFVNDEDFSINILPLSFYTISLLEYSALPFMAQPCGFARDKLLEKCLW
jgi:hypothetical protein